MPSRRDVNPHKSPAELKDISIEKFIYDVGIGLRVGKLVEVDEDYRYWEARLELGDRKLAVSVSDAGIDSAEILEYLALVAHSVDTTATPAQWFDEYGYMFCSREADARVVKDVYADCIRDMLNLKNFLGQDHYDQLMKSVEPAFVRH